MKHWNAIKPDLWRLHFVFLSMSNESPWMVVGEYTRIHTKMIGDEVRTMVQSACTIDGDATFMLLDVVLPTNKNFFASTLQHIEDFQLWTFKAHLKMVSSKWVEDVSVYVPHLTLATPNTLRCISMTYSVMQELPTMTSIEKFTQAVVQSNVQAMLHYKMINWKPSKLAQKLNATHQVFLGNAPTNILTHTIGPGTFRAIRDANVVALQFAYIEINQSDLACMKWFKNEIAELPVT